jgi:hypothetical protein
MIEIFTKIKKNDAALDNLDNNPDAAYMRESAETDKNPPASWNRYDIKTLEGINKVIAMEYQELASFKSMADYRKNLIHLGVALLRAWRITKDAK